ncbi:hypothetical protein FB107DRAFT_279583 [Schizophyllum commune]
MDALGEKKWTQGKADAHRVAWFNRLSEAVHRILAARETPLPDDDDEEDLEDDDAEDQEDAPVDTAPAHARMAIAALLNPTTIDVKRKDLDNDDYFVENSAGDAETEEGEGEGDNDPSDAMDVLVKGDRSAAGLDATHTASSHAKAASTSTSVASLAQPSITSFFGGSSSARNKRPLELAGDDEKPKKKHKKAKEGPTQASAVKSSELTRTGGPVGQSKSATYERNSRKTLQNGTYAFDPKKLDIMVQKLIEIILLEEDSSCANPERSFQVITPGVIRHLKCGKKGKQRGAYYTHVFLEHVKTCGGPPKGKGKAKGLNSANMMPLPFLPISRSASTSASTSTVSASSPSVSVSRTTLILPCPGFHDGVALYFQRPNAGGGGSSSVNVLANCLFNTDFCELSATQKNIVRLQQWRDWVWINDDYRGAVYHRDCTKAAHSPPSVDDEDSRLVRRPGSSELLTVKRQGACASCWSLWRKRRFRQAVLRPVPDQADLKYTNKLYLKWNIVQIYASCKGVKELMEEATKGSPLTLYVQRVVEGKVSDKSMFALLLKAMAIKIGKEERGLSMNISLTSPAAYEMMREHVPLPALRSLKRIQAELPHFPIGINSRGPDIVKELFRRAIGYHGHTAISCDDTKILALLQVYFDFERNAYFIFGNTDEEIRIRPYLHQDILTNFAFLAILKQATLEKATKLRVWCIRATEAPTIAIAVVAALPITNLDAEALDELSWRVIQMLWERDMNVSSYACDGASVERKVQQLLKKRADWTEDHIIRHPGPGCADITTSIARYGKRSLAFMQDPKHAMKTARNNLYSGARALTIGHHVPHFALVHQIWLEDGPLFSRDVNNPDKQDDNAGGWLIDHHPEHIGLIVYLFVVGEMIDAYQSRTLPLAERVIMILRGKLFFEMWEKFLDRAHYHGHYVSDAAAAIIRMLYTGFMETLFIYRDSLRQGSCHPPLCLWLLGSDPVEHIFGLCRQNIPEFTVRDFYYRVPKITLSFRRLVSRSNTDPRTRATGYNFAALLDHTNFDLAALSRYDDVTDAETDKLTRRAYQEANSLFQLAGVSAEELHSPVPDRLPGFNTGDWDMGDTPNALPDARKGTTSPSTFEDGHSGDEDDEPYSEDTDEWDSELELSGEEIEEMRRLLLNRMGERRLPLAARDKVANLAYAEASLEAEKQATINDIVHLTEADIDAQIVDELEHSNPFKDGHQNPARLDMQQFSQYLTQYDKRDHTAAQLRQLLRSSQSDKGAPKLAGCDKLRLSHQTAEAARASRKQRSTSKQDQGEDEMRPAKPRSRRKELLQGFARVAREFGMQSELTGAQRKLRWTGKVTTTTGNAANAAKVTQAAARKRLLAREAVMKRHKILPITQNAGVSAVFRLYAHSSPSLCSAAGGSGYGFVLYKDQIQLCRVIAIYSKTGGKNGRHAAVLPSEPRTASNIDNICAALYLLVQIFEHVALTESSFRVITRDLLCLEVARYALLPLRTSSVFADRITLSSTTGYSPYQLLHGTDPILPMDLAEASFMIQGFKIGLDTSDLLALRIRQLERLKEDVDRAAKTLRKARFVSKGQFENRFARKLTKSEYSTGELVLLRNSASEN